MCQSLILLFFLFFTVFWDIQLIPGHITVTTMIKAAVCPAGFPNFCDWIVKATPIKPVMSGEGRKEGG